MMVDGQGVEITMNSSHAKKFNHNLVKMMDQIQAIFPGEIKRFSFLKFKLKILFAINTKLASELYVLIMEDKIEKIMKRDVDFFHQLDLQAEYDHVNCRINIDYDSFENFLVIFKRFFELYNETRDEKLLEMMGQYLEILMCYSILSTRREDLLIEMNKYRSTPLVMPQKKGGFISKIRRQ